jgi:hypothetical protein
MGDIHGQFYAFQKMFELIRFSHKDRLCVLGDAIDCGSNGIAVLQHIMKTRNISMILGCRESLLYDALVEEQPNGYWYFHSNFSFCVPL